MNFTKKKILKGFFCCTSSRADYFIIFHTNINEKNLKKKLNVTTISTNEKKMKTLNIEC